MQFYAKDQPAICASIPQDIHLVIRSQIPSGIATEIGSETSPKNISTL